MANEEHLKILKQGTEDWNQWKKKNPEITPDLTEATLHKADLSEADLTGASLAGANLYKVDLSGADLNAAEDLTAKQLIATIKWQEAILDSSLRVEAEKLIGQKNR